MNENDYNCFKNNSFFKDGVPNNYINFCEIDILRKGKNNGWKQKYL